jgi:3-hydroxypropanoate dehydrogenase
MSSEFATGPAANPLLEQSVLAQLFLEARTFRSWQDRPVSDELLRRMVDLAKMGPTSVNCSPMRLVFVRGKEAKARLKDALHPGNVAKTMTAPVTAIIAHDLTFFAQLGKLAPNSHPAKQMFESDPAAAAETAFRNGTLQGAYLILAARALGLDCGPLSGFDCGQVDAMFFSGMPIRSNFLCNIGYGDRSALAPRRPRLAFEKIARIV